MTNPSARIAEFLEFTDRLKGDEKGEAQLFCDRLFRAFGHGGILEAHGTLEARIKFSTTGRTKFADCLWSPNGRDGVLIEMKKRGEKDLESHFPQVRDYWIEMNPELAIGPGAQKPTYVILCNFDRFLIYKHLSKVDDVPLKDVFERISAFNFLLTEPREPIFRYNVEGISKETAGTLGELYKYLVHEKSEGPEIAQRFVLQCVLALFSEDFSLLPNGFFTEIIRDCKKGGNSYDLIGDLFHQMARPEKARGGRYREIQYFNGGLFDSVTPLELDSHSIDLLSDASNKNWTLVNPAIFGALFEGTLDARERHAFGAHFTAEADILKIVTPTISKPWRDRIDAVGTLAEMQRLYKELAAFTVLDPACGCGNFLYVAYQSLREIELYLIRRMAERFSGKAVQTILSGGSRVSTRQFKGLDIQAIAVEVAKTTMMIGREVASLKWNNFIADLTQNLDLDLDPGLPLDRLDDCIVKADALFCKWPNADTFIGNPPFQSKNKQQSELPPAYMQSVRDRYPDVPGRADYCVYWFRRTHDEMKQGQRAGLIGTNTIRQNYSRMGGLDYIVSECGVITDAVSSQVWSGDAAVHVSIVNWIKGDVSGKKMLSIQLGDQLESPFAFYERDVINSALSTGCDVTKAVKLITNAKSGACYQGQTHGHKAFLLSKNTALGLIEDEARNGAVLFPYLTGKDELLGAKDSLPKRYIIDFSRFDVFEASKFPHLFKIVEESVKPKRREEAAKEKLRNAEILKANPHAHVNLHHANFYRQWWKLSYGREELMKRLERLPRYIACVRLTKRPIFEFIHPAIHPNDALQVFPLADDYSFGILQSEAHWEWFCARCSTFKRDWRYTSDTVFDSFPWPQSPSDKEIEEVATAAVKLRVLRRQTMTEHNLSLRELYRLMEETPENPVSAAQEHLNLVVRKAYKMGKSVDALKFLLDLNERCAGIEGKGEDIKGPGLPPQFKSQLVSEDCVRFPA